MTSALASADGLPLRDTASVTTLRLSEVRQHSSTVGSSRAGAVLKRSFRVQYA